eukprot:6306379-Prymnesium_polylepis.1
MTKEVGQRQPHFLILSVFPDSTPGLRVASRDATFPSHAGPDAETHTDAETLTDAETHTDTVDWRRGQWTGLTHGQSKHSCTHTANTRF